MKNILWSIFIISVTSQGSFAQGLAKSLVSLEYNDVMIGRNFALTYRTHVSKNLAIYGGVKYHINRAGAPDNQHNLFIKRFFAENRSQHFGLKLGIERRIFNTSHSEFYGFYDFQYTRSPIRHTDYRPVGYDSTDEVVYKYYTWVFGPVNAFENYIGIGARFSLSKNIFINGFIGGGPMFVTYPNEDYVHKTRILGSGFDWEFARMFGVGIEYKLK